MENEIITNFTKEEADIYRQADKIDKELYLKYKVKRGLRDENGQGVVTGLTHISDIISFEEKEDGSRIPCDGQLFYRGYNIFELIKGFTKEKRFGYEETAYLLLFGRLPSQQELSRFHTVLAESSELPTNFTRDVIMKAPCEDIMNSMTKSVLTLASYDEDLNNLSFENALRQCLRLISVFPQLAVYGYNAYNHYDCGESFYIHRSDESLSPAENLLRMLRPDKVYTQTEARVLDTALVLHMEHGGGNNSTFTTRVVTSSGSDTYSVMAAALCSLKGPKHGGANIKVAQMMADIKENVKNPDDRKEIKSYLEKIVDKNAFDKSGLVYGMGHAVYSISDPRVQVFKQFVEQLAKEKDREDDYKLYSAIEQLAPEVIAEKRKIYKGVSANVDFYSGFVYSMLDIPCELFTPLFALARIVGWSAHRMEELVNMDKIIRPAYVSLGERNTYIPMNERK